MISDYECDTRVGRKGGADSPVFLVRQNSGSRVVNWQHVRTYAQHRIRGAMLDFLREEDPLSRTERRRVRESADGLNATGHGIQPTTVSLDQISLRRLAAPAQTGFTIRSEVREARRCLSPRENRVIGLLYDLGWQSREVAADLHVNESRVSQIKQRAISKLRVQLEAGATRRAA
jgi:RNA polymerase sigma factor (sigma-70 family)